MLALVWGLVGARSAARTAAGEHQSHREKDSCRAHACLRRKGSGRNLSSLQIKGCRPQCRRSVGGVGRANGGRVALNRQPMLWLARTALGSLLFRLLAADIELPIAQELLDLAAETEAYAADIEP
jgi:hypothetical protein